MTPKLKLLTTICFLNKHCRILVMIEPVAFSQNRNKPIAPNLTK